MKRGQRRILIGVVVVVACGIGGFFAIGGEYGLLALLYGRNPWKLTPGGTESVRESLRRGEAIVAALRAFHAKEGRYPATLEELIPAYLPAIEHPTVGDCRWRYTVSPDGKVVLKHFIGPLYQTQWWESKTDAWALDI